LTNYGYISLPLVDLRVCTQPREATYIILIISNVTMVICEGILVTRRLYFREK